MKDVIRVEFDGYWLERYQSEIPQGAGVYCVYACEPIAKGRIVVLRELLYIGASDDVRASVARHEKMPAWKKRLRDEEELCFSFARMEHDFRRDVLMAMISHHRPPCNDMDEQELHNIRLMIVGEHELIDGFITVGNE